MTGKEIVDKEFTNWHQSLLQQQEMKLKLISKGQGEDFDSKIVDD